MVLPYSPARLRAAPGFHLPLFPLLPFLQGSLAPRFPFGAIRDRRAEPRRAASRQIAWASGLGGGEGFAAARGADVAAGDRGQAGQGDPRGSVRAGLEGQAPGSAGACPSRHYDSDYDDHFAYSPDYNRD